MSKIIISRRTDHYLWAEKYRPVQFSEFIGNKTIKQSIEKYIIEQDIPHLLFFGPAGTGKTSLAKLLVKHISCDYLYINASDERTIDTIREKIVNFAATVSFNPLRIVILDEADYLPALSQAALRNVMETYSIHSRFILTCNYVERITSPISSRCSTFKVDPPAMETVAEHICNILEKEEVKFELKDVAFVVKSYYPDIRKIINFCQQNVINKTLRISQENAIGSDYKDKLVELLKAGNKAGNFTKIRQLVADASFSNYDEVYSYLFEKVDIYAKDKVAQVILELADAVYQSSLVFEKEITFVAAMKKILNAL